VEPSDLRVRVLEDIREEIRGMRKDLDGHSARMEEFRRDMDGFRRESSARFEVIETALRDVAEQLVMLARGIKAALDARSKSDDRLDDLERRVSELEKRTIS
jgi:predicted  nucleic acid-binding Zn-ribbon protein